MGPRLLRALSAAAVLTAACDPSGPSSAGGGGDPGGGEEPGAAPPPSPAPAPAAAPRWVTVIGGLGNEYLHDLAATGGGAIAALNLVGVDGGRVDELGLHVLEQPDGREASKTFHPVGGVPLHLVPGSLAAAGDELYAAFTAECAGDGCARAAGVAVAGALLVKLSAGGDVVWARPLRGAVTSGVAAGADGAVVATTAGGVTVVHRYRADGALAWEIPGPPLVAAVALAEDGAVLVAAGDAVTRYGPAGRREWAAPVPDPEDVAAAAGAVFVYADGSVVGLDADGAARFTTPVPGASGGGRGGAKRLATAPGGGVSVLAGRGCDAVLAHVEGGGALRWSLPLVRGGCAGDAVEFFGHAATAGGAAVSGVLREDAVDLGVAKRDVSGPMDGFVLSVSE
jgi:hypothetical protein